MTKRSLHPVRMLEVRKGKNLTKAEVGRRAGMQPGTIGWIEEGRFIPYDSQLTKIASVLGVENPDDLLEPLEKEAI